MDPQAAWEQLLDAYQDADWPAATQAAEALSDWLDRGGFPPQTQPQRRLDAAWNLEIARAACRHVIALAPAVS